MEKKKIVELLESMQNKPSDYHFICYAGTVIKALDTWQETPLLNCRYYKFVDGFNSTKIGLGCGYSGKECYCKGILKGEWELDDKEQSDNHTIQKIIHKIKSLEGE